MASSGDRLSARPITDASWDYIGSYDDISDGTCSVCHPAERARLMAEARAIMESRAGA